MIYGSCGANWRMIFMPTIACLAGLLLAGSALCAAEGSIPAGRGAFDPDGYYDGYRCVALYGDLAYVGDSYGFVNVFDIAEPLVPVEIESRALDIGHRVRNLVIQDQLMFVTIDSGVVIVDLTTESVVWDWHTDFWFTYVSVDGDLMAVGYGWTELDPYLGGVKLFDISNPANPQEVGNPPEESDGYGLPFLSGQYLYAWSFVAPADGQEAVLDVYDISDPSIMIPTNHEYLGGAPPREVLIREGLMYAAGPDPGFVILDLADPEAPAVVGQFEPPPYGLGLQVSLGDRVAYLCSWSYGIYGVDVSDPQNPILVAHFETPGYAIEGELRGEVLYVADISEFLAVNVELRAGACCLPEGGCSVEYDVTCEYELGGTFLGEGTECLGDLNGNGFDDGCEPAGACCLGDNTCVVANKYDCETSMEGEYSGDETVCGTDVNGDGIDDACLDPYCCEGIVGNAWDLTGDYVTISDISALIDAKFIALTCDVLNPCLAEADINQSGGPFPSCEDITIGDITMLIDYLFITGPTKMTLPSCF